MPMGISVPIPYEPYQAVREVSTPELHISRVNWEGERTYEIPGVGAESIIAISLVRLLSRPSTSIHLAHALVWLRLLHPSAEILDT